ncbi:hypothetical protein [Caulobacter sp.]|uniref:hypothetical protein n=1 Tax=Caulobacter sp. TaxID=78 RepID=UPI003BAEC05E
MAQSLVSTVSIVGGATGTTTLAPLAAAFDLVKRVNQLVMTPAADRVVADDRDLAAGTSEVLDLSGALVDVYGRPAAFGAVTTILIAGHADNAGELTIGDDPDAPFSGPFSDGGKLRVAAGGFAFLAVTDPERWTAGGALRVANPTGFPATYSVMLVGTATAHVDGMLDFSDPDNSGLIAGL